VPLYLMAWKQTNRPEFRAVAESILTWAEREMSDAQGGYDTSLDADTGGAEGTYYTWTPGEVQAALGAKDAPVVSEYYGVTPKGEVRGRSVLAPTAGDKDFAARHALTPEAWHSMLEGARKALLAARQRRPHPACDDKVLTSWNGLMVSALAAAHVATGERSYLDRAQKTAGFALRSLRDTNGAPRVSWRRGRAGGPGFLDDSAFLIRGLLDLNAADHDAKWLEAAAALTRDAGRFADPDGGWFFAADTPDLIVRPRGLDDTALPSGSAIMVENLARLSYLAGDVGALSTAGRTLDRGAQVMRSDPTSHPYLILARESVMQARRAGASGAASAPSLAARQPLTPDPPKPDPPAAAGVKGQVVGRGNHDRVVEAEWSFPPEATRPGGAAIASIAMHIKDGWHVNSATPTLDYLIATKVTISDPGGTTVEAIDYPPGKMVKLQFAEQELSVYQGTVTIKPRLRVPPTATPSSIPIVARLVYQSCSDKACLPPETVEFKAPLVVAGAPLSGKEMAADVAARSGPEAEAPARPALAPLAGERKGNDQLSVLMRERGLLSVLGVIFLGGLALCLTPCVYPMIPVTLGFFSQQATGTGWGRRLAMPALYVLGMAITYSVLGVIAGLTGGLFGAALQNKWLVGALVLLFVAMAFWMFGVYELRLPGFLTRFGAGRAGALGAFLMGLTLGLVAAPCIGPFIVTLLAFVGASGSPLLGFWMFFVLALGMGLPFLVLGAFSGMLSGLPRSGMWLIYAKKVMGIGLLAVALYFLQPFLTDRVLGWSAIVFALAAGLYLAWLERTRMKAAWFGPLRVVVGVATVVLGLWLALPLVRAREEIPWQAYSDQALDAARASGKPVLIDFFAVWCAPCRELDRHTYSDPRVASHLERFALLKADLTNEESPQVQALRGRFDVYGVPTVVFLGADGTDRKDLRLTGFEPPESFVKRLEQVR
jgi:thiol:disulfide interchange protein DsbD